MALSSCKTIVLWSEESAMVPLTSRVTLRPLDADAATDEDPEDILFSSLGTVYPDDTPILHGDSHSRIQYESPNLSRPISLRLADPDGDQERSLFSHYLWNAGLVLADMMERDSRDDAGSEARGKEEVPGCNSRGLFDVRGLNVLEMGSGVGLPSIVAGLHSAKSIVATDYPSARVLEPLKANLDHNITASASPSGTVPSSVLVKGHIWGVFETTSSTKSFPKSHHHAADRVLIADCLWMPWQHKALAQSIEYFLSLDPTARCWCVAASHTGRAKMAKFFDVEVLGSVGLAAERIWEQDITGLVREWDGGKDEEIGSRKRWSTIALLKRSAPTSEAGGAL